MTHSRKPALAYTRADLQRWNADMLLKRPVQPRPEGLVTGLNILSFVAGASGNGLYLQITDGHGEEGLILLNPVVAAALHAAISELGRKAHWLEDDNTPTVPDR